jgi:HD superfamily phosphohydrolase
MALQIVRRLRDNLLGSVDISQLEDKVIDQAIFQRLRRIKQTAFLSFVFPGATHSRFEHSLGVMHLAEKAWAKLKDNQVRLKQAYRHNPMLEQIFASDYILQILRLAALLHDVGHPPYSHSGERFLPGLAQLLADNPDLPPYLKNFYQNKLAESKKSGGVQGKKAVRHEYYSLLLIDRLLTQVYRDHPELSLKIPAQDVISVIMPEIDPVPNSDLLRLKVNKLCNELVSGEVDIDRMDYLQRDSNECGVVYGMFDRDRILDSLSLYLDEGEQSLHLAIQFSGLAAYEDYLRARQSMYLQLYFHKTSVACEAMLKYLHKLCPHYRLPAKVDDYIKVDDAKMVEHLLAALQDSALNPSEKSEAKVMVEDVFYHRRLWKRVYETSSLLSHDNGGNNSERAKEILSAQGIVWEEMSSTNFLTNAVKRGGKSLQRNYLKLIKKDEIQGVRVVDIEDYSQLYKIDHGVRIERLYVRPQDVARAKLALQQGW